MHYEVKIKKTFSDEGITDSFDKTSMFFFGSFPFYLSDYEGKVKDQETIECIKKYKMFFKFLIGFALGFWVVGFIDKVII